MADEPGDGDEPEWYCPFTREIVPHPRRGLFCHRCGQGHRIVRLERPIVSSDIAALGGIAIAMSFSAVLLWLAGYLVLYGAAWWKVAAGCALAVVGFGFPFYEAIASIHLGWACKKIEGYPYMVGWVSMAKGAGILTGSFLVLMCVIYLISSDTARFLYGR
jgi:hypothetical protein